MFLYSLLCMYTKYVSVYYYALCYHAKDLQTLPLGGVVHTTSHESPPLHMGPTKGCYRCSEKHRSSECCFQDANCNYCSKRGHISKVCCKRLRETSKSDRAPQDCAPPLRRGKPQRTPQSTHLLQDDEASQVVHTDPDVYTLFKVKSGKVAPLITTVEVNGTDLAMEEDTGASLSLISEETYRSHWPADTAPTFEPSSISVWTYSGEELRVLGSLTVSVRYKEQEH